MPIGKMSSGWKGQGSPLGFLQSCELLGVVSQIHHIKLGSVRKFWDAHGSRRLFGLGCIALGWSIQLHAPLAVVLVAGFFTGMATPVISLGELDRRLLPETASSIS